MIDLPTLIALLAPVFLLFVLDQVIRRVFARRRPRAVDAQVHSPQVLGPAATAIGATPSAEATDQAATARVA